MAEEKIPGKIIHYVKKKELKNIPVIAYYFSASWCEHSQAFTKLLIDFYNEVNKEKK